MSDQEKQMSREDILITSLKAREHEVMMYQINIDNYTLALNEISKLPSEERAELSKFSDQLHELLKSEKLEQKKSKIMLEVVKQQVG